MQNLKSELLELIRKRAFKLGDFKLASGDRSKYYIDGKMMAVHSRSAYLIGEVLYECTKDLAFDAIGGLEAGAIPLTTAVAISYHHHGREMEGFWVRDAAKTHGAKKMIEGGLKPDSRVVIVEDVVTRGESAFKAIKEVEKIGCTVVRVIALVDRLTGAKNLFTKHGIKDYTAVYTVADLGVSQDIFATVEVPALQS